MLAPYRIFAKLLRIADEELGIVTEDELTNLLDHDALPSRQHSSRNADKKRSASSHEEEDDDFKAQARTTKRAERAVKRARQSSQSLKTVKRRHAIWPQKLRRQSP
jgi:hypothetical protein